MKIIFLFFVAILISHNAYSSYISNLQFVDIAASGTILNAHDACTITFPGSFGYEPDLNQGAGSDTDYIYLCVTYSDGSPRGKRGLTEILTAGTDNAVPSPPDGYTTPQWNGDGPLDLNKNAGGKFIYLWTVFSDRITYTYIEDMKPIASGSAEGAVCDPGYTKDNIDLNWGAGGDFIYFCYKPAAIPIIDVPYVTELYLVDISPGGSIPTAEAACNNAKPGSVGLEPDLNQGAGSVSDYIYLCVTYSSGDPTSQPGLTNLTVTGGENNPSNAPSGYTTVPNSISSSPLDLNRGVSNPLETPVQIYLWQQLSSSITNTYIEDIKTAVSSVSGDDAVCPDGYIKNDIDLNWGAGGDWIYICYKSVTITT